MATDLSSQNTQETCPSVVFAGACTDVGRVRESNQDSYIADVHQGLFLVADGMGGRAGGEVASQLASHIISSEVERNLERLLTVDERTKINFFAAAINKASLGIYERSLELPQYRGMGTTATLLWLPPQKPLSDLIMRKSTDSSGPDLLARGRLAGTPLPRVKKPWGGADSPELTEKDQGTTPFASAIIAHVGDSRCYLCRAGLLFQLTDDHSLVNEQIKAGIISARDPMVAQIRNVITRCVGYQEEEEVDTLMLDVMPGDRFLLCSDGLSTKVSDEEIRLALLDPDIATVADRLTELANQRGGDDNITVVVVST